MPCHRNAMGSNRQTVPKVCGKKGCREQEGERDKGSVKGGGGGGALLSAVP